MKKLFYLLTFQFFVLATYAQPLSNYVTGSMSGIKSSYQLGDTIKLSATVSSSNPEVTVKDVKFDIQGLTSTTWYMNTIPATLTPSGTWEASLVVDFVTDLLDITLTVTDSEDLIFLGTTTTKIVTQPPTGAIKLMPDRNVYYLYEVVEILCDATTPNFGATVDMIMYTVQRRGGYSFTDNRLSDPVPYAIADTGVYDIYATVMDSYMATMTTDTVTITVVRGFPTGKMVSNRTNFHIGEQVVLSTEASSPLNGGKIIWLEYTVKHRETGETLTLAAAELTPDLWSSSYSFNTAGTYDIFATVTDNVSNEVQSDTISITILPANLTPDEINFSVKNGDNYSTNQPVVLNSNPIADDGATIINVTYTITDTITKESIVILGVKTQENPVTRIQELWAANWTPSKSGVYSIVVTITDSKGNVKNSSPVYATITDPTTSYSDLTFKNSVKVYPIPAVDQLTILFGQKDVKNIKAEIIELESGKVLLVSSELANGSSIDISALPSGVYIARINTQDLVVLKKFTVIK